MPAKDDKSFPKKISPSEIEVLFSDFDSRSNLVGLYDLLLKVAKRNPKLWDEIQQAHD